MKLSEIHIRDPYVLVENDQYYLYGSRGDEAWGKCTGLDVYVSCDLEEWTNPVEVFSRPENFWSDMNYWAPEVHKYNGKFYMFVSFKSTDKCRGTQILVSDNPMGPFLLHSDGPITPSEWECLDGTLYVNKSNTPFMIFCHEWIQVKDGEMCAVQLSSDLKKSIGQPFLLYRASEPAWALKDKPTYVTDGPFIHRTSEGKLLMIWSSFSENGYVEAVSYPDNGEIDGKWLHSEELLFPNNGGHGMLFVAKNNKLMFIMHTPNESPKERPVIAPVFEKDGMLYMK